MLVTLKKDEFLSNQVNKQKFINLLSENLEHAGYSTRHAKGDADVMIVDTAITKARDQTTVLIGEDTDTGRKNGFTNVCERCKYVVNLELQICITFALSAKVWANTYIC